MTQGATRKPLPEITDLTRPFWTAAAEGRLVMQRCARCATVAFPPKPWCVECGSRDLAWAQVGPGGTVFSFTVSRSVAMNHPAWAEELPVILGLIDVDEGARMYAQIVGCAPEAVAIGARVTLEFAPAVGGVAIPRFRLAGS